MDKHTINLILQLSTEINRMEMNLLYMDSATKGFQQLQRSLKRMKIFLANSGFELTDMIGKPYNTGIVADVDFVFDDSLQPGEQIIRTVNRPQIMFKGVMIQKASIIVAQNK